MKNKFIFLIADLLLTVCGGSAPAKETCTIGMINIVPALE